MLFHEELAKIYNRKGHTTNQYEHLKADKVEEAAGETAYPFDKRLFLFSVPLLMSYHILQHACHLLRSLLDRTEMTFSGCIGRLIFFLYLICKFKLSTTFITFLFFSAFIFLYLATRPLLFIGSYINECLHNITYNYSTHWRRKASS